MFSSLSKLSTAQLLLSRAQSRFLLSDTTNTLFLPTQNQISHLILDQKSPDQALQTFQWASKIPSFTHTPSTYRALIHKLCTFRKFSHVDQLLDEMPNSIGAYPDDDIFITIVRGFGRARMVKEVIGVMHLVNKFGKCEPSLKLMNSILDVLVKEDIDIAREFYRRKMMGSGLEGDDYTYGILMKGFCLTNRIGDGFELLQLMKNRGLSVSVVVYNTLLHALCKNGKVGRARSLMSEMKEFTDVSFNTVISAYCNEGNLVQALVMIEKCFRNGLLPDAVTLTKIIGCFCGEGRISDAVDLLDRFEEKGGKVGIVAYNSLIRGFVKAGKVRSGCEFLKQMEMKGCLPNTDTYNVLIAGFCELGMLDSALDMFHEMKRVGANWNIVTFETLTYGLCSRGRTDDGFKIFEFVCECKESYRRVGPYNNILYGLYKENRLDEAIDFLNKMKHLFPRAVDRSFKILQLSQDDCSVDEAKNVLYTMKEQGLVPNVFVYAILVQGLCRNGSLKESVELMNEMIGQGYFPKFSAFNALIDRFCRLGKFGAAVRLLDDLKVRGGTPDFESYGLVICGFCSQGEIEQAFILLMQMVQRGLTPDYFVWNVLVVVLFRGKDMFQVHKLFQSLINECYQFN